MLDKFDLRCSGDNWNGIMKDTLREECDASDDCLRNCCVNQYVAPLFFVVFVLMAQFVLVNVVVAVLMKHLEESHKQVKLYRQTAASVEKMMKLTIYICTMQVKFEDLFLAQCFKLCFLESKEKLSQMFGRDLSDSELREKADLTHRIETYFD